MKQLGIFFISFCLLMWSSGNGFASASINKDLSDTLLIQSGLISGTKDIKSQILSFKGIPFAAPPVNDLRWKAPQPVENWNGVRNCVAFSASAMQQTPMPFLCWTQEFIAPEKPLSEDCLYLNVWTGAQSGTDKLPVIVFIHGGGFSSGSGSVPVYDGEEMAKKGVVFVTINYRVGIFGFFAHPELSAENADHTSGNYGLSDQIAALKWIQKNIAVFGGNPSNVTIAGQSAGAFSVNFLVASPLAKGLFQRAIAESGGAILSTSRFAKKHTLKEAELAGLDLSRKLKAESIADLRKLPAEELLKEQTMSSPIIDGFVLPTDLYTIFSEGKQNDVPVLMGWNAREGNFSGAIADAITFKQQAEKIYGETVSHFLKLFPAATNQEAEESQIKLSGLQTFGIQAFKWMEFQNRTGKSKVYMYHFTRDVPHGEGQKDFGAFHTGEVPYAYKNLHTATIRPWQDTDYKLAETMSSYWVNFARNGDPNQDGLPVWNPCRSDDFVTMFLGDQVKSAKIPDLERLQFLEKYFESQLP